ncbi:MAG: hypothetical protein AAGE52_32250 [Myxococcota bacterium]
MRRALFWVLLAACQSGGQPAGPLPLPPRSEVCTPVQDAPLPEALQWKRVAAFETDLLTALALPRESGCLELGSYVCGEVHRVALGGQDVEGSAQYEPAASPLATTPLVVDRVVLGACAERVRRDQDVPVVFEEVDFAAERVPAAQVEVQAIALYRRLLTRDPNPDEVAVLQALARDLSPTDWAVASCFAIGTTTEAVMF